MSWVNVAIVGSSALNQYTAGKTAAMQGQLSKQMGDYQAKVEQQTALETAALIRRAGRRQVGEANAAFAAAGVQVGQGSAAEVERDITQGYEHDAYQALLDGGRRARAAQLQGEFDRIDGHMRENAGRVAAVNTALSQGYGYMRASGWRSKGPGYAGTQSPAPVEIRDVPRG